MSDPRCCFANKVFDSLDAATEQAERGLTNMAANRGAMECLTSWPWIKSINLIARQNKTQNPAATF
jgi:hypothetical protein